MSSSKISGNGSTFPISRCNSTSHTCDITIKFRDSYLTTATDLAIARTAIHESLHAIFVRMYELDLLISPNGQPLNGFSDLVQAYIDYLKGLPSNINTAHHELMDEFISEMATSLSIYDQQNSNSLSFNYYKKLCWSGLTDTSEFKTLYPKYLNPLDEFNNPANYNPAWLDIKLTIETEKYNETKSYSHPNGQTYSYSPQGFKPNETAPCH